MKIHCSRCGKFISSVEVSSDTIILTWVECLECVEKQQQENMSIIEKFTCRTYSSSTAQKLMNWVRENLSPEQLETLKDTVEKINERKEKGYE